jgi:alkyl sulfatase BDS1-like metallo-beta-lactamase superfamily hydrolase
MSQPNQTDVHIRSTWFSKASHGTTVCKALMAGILTLGAGNEAVAAEHFNAKGQGPSEHTKALQQDLRASLPFEDTRDFEESRRGFIAAPDSRQILDSAGNIVWDLGAYDFLLSGESFDSIHPSLQRLATLNMNFGLYEVVPDFIYQVRGFDLANLTLIRGDTGWILFDVMLTKETAEAALALANQHLGQLPVKAVVYSHSHIDHFGGVLGVTTVEAVNAGDVQIYAPKGFMQEAISENVYAGYAMTRRAAFQYGQLVPPGIYGRVDSAIGKGLPVGTPGLIPPTVVVEEAFEEHVIDGVRVVFQNTPGTEAPSEMNAWFPDSKVFWAAENITATIHNIYTLRGALVRDALAWSKHINIALYEFGQDAEVMIASHNWPRWGNARIQDVMRTQRDTYANLNNQVLHLANQGVTINEIHNEYRVPAALGKQWSARQYHGSEFHNTRGVLSRYLGFWDGNPATLVPLSPYESAPLYVEMMGGSDNIMTKAAELTQNGQYRHATELLNKLVYAEPDNQPAKDSLATVYEQLGYQYESSTLRNVFLSAAQELRAGTQAYQSSQAASPSLARAMTTEQWWDAVAIRVDSAAAEGLHFVMNFSTPDTGETFVIEMGNGTLSSLPNYVAKEADVSVAINRSDLETVIMGQNTLGSLLAKGVGQVSGDPTLLASLQAVLVAFDPMFEIIPGTER